MAACICVCVCVCSGAQEAALRGSRPTISYLQKWSLCVCVIWCSPSLQMQFIFSMSLMLAKELKFRVCVVLQRLCSMHELLDSFHARWEESEVVEGSLDGGNYRLMSYGSIKWSHSAVLLSITWQLNPNRDFTLCIFKCIWWISCNFNFLSFPWS